VGGGKCPTFYGLRVRDAATRARGGQRDRRGLSTEAPVGTHGQFAVLISPSCCPTGAHRRGPGRPAGAAGNRSRPPASRCQMRAGVCTCVGPNEAAHQSYLPIYTHVDRCRPAGRRSGTQSDKHRARSRRICAASGFTVTSTHGKPMHRVRVT